MSAERATRGRPSRFDSLPPELRAYVDRRLREGATQADIRRETAGALAEHGEPPLSAGGLNRYASRMERSGRRIREIREASDAWVARFGEMPTGNVGRYLVEILRSLAVDLSHQLEDIALGADPGEASASIDMLNNLALLTQRLQRSDEMAVGVERKLREQMAAEAETVARAVGIGNDTAAALREALTTLPMAA